MRLPISEYQLMALAEQTSSAEAVRSAIKSGVFNFIIEAHISYSSIELQDKNLLDGMTAVGGLDLGRKILENIETDFQAEIKRNDEKVDEVGKDE